MVLGSQRPVEELASGAGGPGRGGEDTTNTLRSPGLVSDATAVSRSRGRPGVESSCGIATCRFAGLAVWTSQSPARSPSSPSRSLLASANMLFVSVSLFLLGSSALPFRFLMYGRPYGICPSLPDSPH